MNKIVGFDEGVMASLDQAMDYSLHLLEKYSKEMGNRPSPLEAIIIDDEALNLAIMQRIGGEHDRLFIFV